MGWWVAGWVGGHDMAGVSCMSMRIRALRAPPQPCCLTTPALPLPLQGAGGNCNVVKEIIYPLGAEIDVRAIRLGDKTMR